jgi:predicted Zn-dependent protease
VSQSTPFGDRIFQHLKATVCFESADWAIERVERVSGRLQQDVPTDKRLCIEIPWLDEVNAFTAQGKYIFMTRRLFELCQNDEMVAFIAAHEIAHHHLGHLNILPEWISRVAGDELGLAISILHRMLGGRIYAPEHECDADKYGLDMCANSGYDATKCIKVLDVLEKHALDVGDLGMAFGPEESDDELADDAPFLTRLKIWIYQRQRGYLPIRDRRQMLLNYIARKSSPGRV